jgi:hypothetical protein
MSGIGVLNEKPLHAALKQWYSEPGDLFEVAVDGFVIDIVRDDLLIEIQTGNFSAIRSKLTTLARSHRVRLVHPIAQEKWIVRPATGGRGRLSRRKSPSRGRLEDLFRELVSIPHLLSHAGFSLEVLMTREEEVRRFERARGWSRHGWVIEARRLLEVVDRRVFGGPADWRALVPPRLDAFTASDLAEGNQTRPDLAQKMAYCLRHGHVIELIGRRGRANLYRTARGRPTDTAPGESS